MQAVQSRRAKAAILIGVMLLAVVMFVSWHGTGETKFCTAEGRIGPEGQVYGRDPGHECKFVDEHGNVLPGQ